MDRRDLSSLGFTLDSPFFQDAAAGLVVGVTIVSCLAFTSDVFRSSLGIFVVGVMVKITMPQTLFRKGSHGIFKKCQFRSAVTLSFAIRAFRWDFAHFLPVLSWPEHNQSLGLCLPSSLWRDG